MLLWEIPYSARWLWRNYVVALFLLIPYSWLAWSIFTIPFVNGGFVQHAAWTVRIFGWAAIGIGSLMGIVQLLTQCLPKSWRERSHNF